MGEGRGCGEGGEVREGEISPINTFDIVALIIWGLGNSVIGGTTPFSWLWTRFTPETLPSLKVLSNVNYDKYSSCTC